MVQIRPATLDDAAAIARVKVDTWRSAYTGIVPQSVLDNMNYADVTEQWQYNLRNPLGVTLLAFSGQVLVGYGTAGPVRGQYPPCDAEILALYVHQSHQGQGIGKKLVNACADYLLSQGYRALLIWVLTNNTAGRAFYEAMGGHATFTQTFKMGKVSLQETGYVWPKLAILASPQ